MFKSAVLTLSLLTVNTSTANALSSRSDSCKTGIIISFSEGAPVDRFEIKNTSENWQIVDVEIDLSSSKGRLIFDTVSGGKGVEVFQPYKTVSGSAKIIKIITVKDGSDAMLLDFERFNSGQSYTFSIDVDDQLTSSELGQIRVTGSEMELAQANFTLESPKGERTKAQAIFNNQNQARLNDATCNS